MRAGAFAASASKIALLAGALGVAVWMRVRNAFHYPPDWGFDASFNWQYIARLSHDWSLPHPAAAWATADPPLFYYLGGLVMRGLEALGSRDAVLYTIPLLNASAGFGIAALAWLVVRRLDPAHGARSWLAAGLLLYLPAHVQMSVMVNEEIWCALFTAGALALLARPRGGSPGSALPRVAAAGFLSGLALLTKLSGAVAVAVAGASAGIAAWRRVSVARGVAHATLVVVLATLAGGWYFVRNQVRYGYLQPFGLPTHELLFELPPGQRGLLDYVRLPLATFTDPQLLNEALLRSVWGSTYATVWFDGHRYFLPVDGEGVRYLGTAVLVLALLPTAAFATGFARGVRRAMSTPDGPDTPLVLCVVATLSGYALYTYRNPWYAVVKGTSLLALCLPYAVYASGELSSWARHSRTSAVAVVSLLGLLATGVVAGSTFDFVFEKNEVSGLPWRARSAP